MESNSEGQDRDAAIDALDMLRSDRERLAGSVAVPWGLLAAFGALSGWWVSGALTTNPGADYTSPTSGWLVLVGALVVAHQVRRETGVHLRGMGGRGGLAVAGIVVANLALFSVSLGLVSLGLQWGVALTSASAFAITTWLAAIAYRSALEKLRSE